MKTYCSGWRAAVLVVTGMAVVGGSATRSPWLFVAEGVALGALGAAFGAAWEMDAGTGAAWPGPGPSVVPFPRSSSWAFPA